jgi:hypothetical protein
MLSQPVQSGSARAAARNESCLLSPPRRDWSHPSMMRRRCRLITPASAVGELQGFRAAAPAVEAES